MTYPRRMLPVALNLEGRPCVVVGGGPVAERKVEQLLEAGARVQVVAPEVTPALEAWAREGRIAWAPRPYREGDLEGVAFAVAATDDPEVNSCIFAEARRRNVLLNAVDDPPHCDVYFMSLVRRGWMTVAISSTGRSPALAAHLRRWLERVLPPDLEGLGETLARWRPRALAELDPGTRMRFWHAVEDLPLLELWSEGGAEAVEAAVAQIFERFAVRSEV